MKFKVLLHKKADKFLRELKPEEKKRIIDKLRQLEDFPATRLEIVKIAGEENTLGYAWEIIERYSKSTSKKK